MFHASEGGPVSVGRPKFRSRSGATPTPAPQNKFEAVPVGIPGYRTDRISRIGGMTPASSPAPASITEIVLSKTSLAGICLIAFACGIVTTVMVDRAPSRASEHEVAARQPEPAAPQAAPAAAQVAAARVAARPTAPAPLAQVQATPAPTAAAPTAATAGEPVVVQMPNLAETSGAHTTVALRSSAPASSRASARQRPAAAASAKAAAVPAKGAATPAKAAATAPGKKSKTATAGAPAGKWIDPFSE